MAITPTGKFVFVANNESGNVWVYSVATSGALKPVKGSPFVTVAHPSGIAVDPTGKFAYVASAGYGSPGKVSGYSINATTGALAPVKGSPFQAGTTPYGVAVDPTSKFVYVTNYGSKNVSAYTIDASSGALTAVKGSPFGAGTEPEGIAVDPKGTFAYVTNYDSRERFRLQHQCEQRRASASERITL